MAHIAVIAVIVIAVVVLAQICILMANTHSNTHTHWQVIGN